MSERSNSLSEDAASARGTSSMRWTFDTRDTRCVREVRKHLLAHLRMKGRPDADYSGAELVFGELIGNVIRHAPGIVEIEFEWHGSAPVLHVLDRGPGFELVNALPSPSSESGRGLFLIAELSREFTVTRRPGHGSHARAILPVDRHPSRLSGIRWPSRSR